jgi:hypothetical protein
MKEVHLSIPESMRIPTPEAAPPKAGHSGHYKNYLSDLQLTNSRSTLTFRDFERTLSLTHLSEIEKLEKLRSMMQAKERQSGKGDAELIDAIKSKMAVLKQLIR